MTRLNDYLERYSAEIDATSRKALTRLTDDQFQIVLDAVRYISGSNEPKPGVICDVDVIDYSIACIDEVRFKMWALPGMRRKLPLDVPAVVYSLVQVRLGDPWLSLVVVDFDSFRVALRVRAKDCDGREL